MRLWLPNQSTFSPQDSLCSLKLRSFWWTLTVLIWSGYFGMNGKLVVVKTNCRLRNSHTPDEICDCELSFLFLRSSYALKLLCHSNCSVRAKTLSALQRNTWEKKTNIECPFPFGITMATIFLPVWPATIDIIICCTTFFCLLPMRDWLRLSLQSGDYIHFHQCV